MNDLRVVFIETLPLYENHVLRNGNLNCNCDLMLAVEGAIFATAIPGIAMQFYVLILSHVYPRTLRWSWKVVAHCGRSASMNIRERCLPGERTHEWAFQKRGCRWDCENHAQGMIFALAALGSSCEARCPKCPGGHFVEQGVSPLPSAIKIGPARGPLLMAEPEGFEPSIRL
jgi:hypothetical protein